MNESLQYFEAVAEEWDEIRTGLFPDDLRCTVGCAAALAPGLVAADLGAGTGFLTEELLARGAEVIAVDQSEAMLETLHRKLAPAAGGRLQVRVGTAEALPLPDASVDRVVANMFLHHVEDPAVAIREGARVLRPGGRIVISDLDRHEHEFLLTEQHDRWPGFARADVERWLGAAGFTGIEVRDARATCCGSSSCGGETARIEVFLAVAELPGAA